MNHDEKCTVTVSTRTNSRSDFEVVEMSFS